MEKPIKEESLDIEEQSLKKQMEVADTPQQRIPRFSWWWLASSLAAGLVFGIGLLFSIQFLARPLALLIISIAIATAMAPLVMWLTQRFRISRGIASVLVFLLVILLFAAIGGVLVPGLIAQAGALIERIPSVIELVGTWIDQWGVIDQSTIVDTIFAQVGSFSSNLVTLPILIFSSLFDVLLILFIALYWLLLMPSMRSFALSLFPQQRQEGISNVLHDMGQAMGGYVRGTLINAIIVGLLTYIGLVIIGVEYAGVLGVLAGLLEVIPILGPLIAGVVIVAFALVESPTIALIAAIYMLVMQQVESNVLVPNIMRREANVSPLLVLIAVYVGGTLGGLAWALASIPLVAGLTVFFKQVIAPAIRKNTGAIARED